MARTQTLERPIHVEAPSWWRTALRYNLWVMFGVGATIAALLVLAVVPAGSIGPAGGLSAFFVLALVAAVACAAATRYWQRDDPEAYPLMLLVSMILALAGGLISGDAFRRLSFEGPPALSIPMLPVGFWILVVAALAALAALVQLFGFARERRGRWIAVSVFVWSASFAAIPQALLFGFPTYRSVSDEVQLAVVSDEAGYLDMGGGGIFNVLSLTTGGALHVGDRSMSYDDEAAVRAELERIGSHEDRHGFPLGAIVALDREERFGRAVEFLDRCADAGLRHVRLAAEPGSYGRAASHWYPGVFFVGTGQTGGPWDADAPRPSTWLDLRLVPSADGSLAYALDGAAAVGFAELDARLRGRREPQEQLHLRLVADADLSWATVMRAVDELNWKVPARLDGFAVAN